MSEVAVSALGGSLDDKVDERFGRAHFMLFVDPESLEFESVDNSDNRNALQGAGIGTAELVSAHGAQAVVTGHLGPKAKSALDAALIPGFVGTGMTVREAVAALDQGLLVPIQEAS